MVHRAHNEPPNTKYIYQLENLTMYKNNNINPLPIFPTDNEGFVRVVVNIQDRKQREDAIKKYADKAGVSLARVRVI